MDGEKGTGTAEVVRRRVRIRVYGSVPFTRVLRGFDEPTERAAIRHARRIVKTMWPGARTRVLGVTRDRQAERAARRGI